MGYSLAVVTKSMILCEISITEFQCRNTAMISGQLPVNTFCRIINEINATRESCTEYHHHCASGKCFINVSFKRVCYCNSKQHLIFVASTDYDLHIGFCCSGHTKVITSVQNGIVKCTV